MHEYQIRGNEQEGNEAEAGDELPMGTKKSTRTRTYANSHLVRNITSVRILCQSTLPQGLRWASKDEVSRLITDGVRLLQFKVRDQSATNGNACHACVDDAFYDVYLRE